MYSLLVGFLKELWYLMIVFASSKMYSTRFQALSSRVKTAYRHFETVDRGV